MKNFKGKRITVVVLVVSILFLSGGFYFLNNRKFEVNLFDYMLVEVEGISENASLLVTPDIEKIKKDYPNEKKATSIMQTITDLRTYDNTLRLQNGDIINLKLSSSENKKILNKNNIIPIQYSKEVKITSLPVVPNTWGEVEDKESVLFVANGAVEKKKAGAIQSLVRYEAQQGANLDIAMDQEVVSIYYKKEIESCNPTFTEEQVIPDMCGTVIFLSKYTPIILTPNYYYANPIDYYSVEMVTNIYQGEGVTPALVTKVDDRWFDYYEDRTLEQIHDTLVGRGYERV